jgi:hypothetical protein
VGVIGANWVEDQRLNPFSIATGTAPRGPTEVVIDQNTFDSDHHALGDTITVLAKGEPRPSRCRPTTSSLPGRSATEA